MNTHIIEGLEHPSWPGIAIPAILTGQPPDNDICWHCQWLAIMIRAGLHVNDYAMLAIRHVAAEHS